MRTRKPKGLRYSIEPASNGWIVLVNSKGKAETFVGRFVFSGADLEEVLDATLEDIRAREFGKRRAPRKKAAAKKKAGKKRAKKKAKKRATKKRAAKKAATPKTAT